MKSALPFFAFVLALASCTTAYQSAQTPDDVYYSPARPQDAYVARTERQEPSRYEEQSDDDRYLRMKARNRRTWSDLDYYYSDPYAYNYDRYRFSPYGNVYANTPWDYYSSWNYYYNPYNSYYNNYYSPYGYNPYPRGGHTVMVTPRPPVYNRPRTFNLNVYNPSARNSYDSRNPSRRVYRGDNRNFNYNTNNNNSYSSGNDRGSGLRNIFNNNTSNSSSSSMPTRSQRSFSSSSPSGSSSGSRSSGSTNAPVRRF